MSVAPLASIVETHAVAKLRDAPLWGSTALHIATAQAARGDQFVTADPCQAEAARRRGMANELIES